MAELFTSSHAQDMEYIDRVGINSILREIQSVLRSSDLSLYSAESLTTLPDRYSTTAAARQRSSADS